MKMIINLCRLFYQNKSRVLFLAALFVLVNVNFIYSQSIMVTIPNGGETWRNGIIHNIEWTNTGTVTNVNIELSTDGGSSFNPVVGPIPNTNSFAWTVPDLNEPDVRIKVNDAGSSATDISDANFRIIFPNINSSPIKILPIGNSITFDQFSAEPRFAQYKISYRYKLWDLLRTSNYNIDFIGHRLGGYSLFPDPENDGIPGIKDNQMDILLRTGWDPYNSEQVTHGNYLETYNPDAVLLHIGTNGVDVDQSATDVESMLNWIDDFEVAQSKEIWVILALIIDDADNAPPDTGGNDPDITAFNNNIKSMAQIRINNGDKILIVDMQHALYYRIDTSYPYSEGDMYDGYHPNDGGKDKMANVWFEALKLILPNSITSSPNITSVPITTAYVGLPYRYNVNATGVGAPDYFFVTPPPGGMTINQTTGIIDWIPGVSDVGNHTIEVKASNFPGGDSPIQQFTINVSSAPTLTDGLVSYWRMDETGSPLSFEDLPGINDAYPIVAPSIVSGVVGNAISFDGITNKVDVMDDSSLYFFPGENFTIETWVKTTQGGATERVFLGKNGGATYYFLGKNASNQTKFAIKDSVGNTITVLGPGVNDGYWHHLAGSIDRTTNKLSIFVDGVGYSTTWAFKPSGFFSHGPLTFGYYKYNNFYNGLLDEVAIYNRRVLGTEIARHYISGLSRKGYTDNYVLVKAKAFLQGPYNSSAGLMDTTLKANNLIPKTLHPYTDAPWSYDGLERVVSYPDSVVDWVLVELRDSLNPATVIATRSAFIKKSGYLVELDPINTGSSDIIFTGISPGNYYIVIKHRNHLGIMSALPVALSKSPALYDFTTAQTQAYGTNAMKDLLGDGTVFGMFAGDANKTGSITVGDLTTIIPFLNNAGYMDYDINLSGTVTVGDLTKAIPNLNTATQIPN